MTATVPALWVKHRPLARTIAADFWWPGAEHQDVIQEAEIGLWVACRDYRDNRGASFKTFAALVIKRRLSTCVKTAKAPKRGPLDAAVRTTGDETDAIVDQLPCLHQLSDRVEDREQLRVLMHAIDHDLTDFERHCVIGFAAGVSYLDLGPFKRVDNALRRAREKLRDAA